MNLKLPDFIIIPYPLLYDPKITLIDERLYGIIYWFTKLKNEKCTASNVTLAKLVKTSAGTIKNSLTKLEEQKYIKRVMDEGFHRKEIIPLVVFARINPSLTDDGGSLTSYGGGHSQMHRIRILRIRIIKKRECMILLLRNFMKIIPVKWQRMSRRRRGRNSILPRN